MCITFIERKIFVANIFFFFSNVYKKNSFLLVKKKKLKNMNKNILGLKDFNFQ